jgi:hypothetical protein
MRTCDESKPSTYWEAVDSFSRFSIGRVLVDGDGRAKPRQQAVMPILLILSPKAAVIIHCELSLLFPE